MRNLLLFLIRYGGFFLFIVYQVFCFYLIVNYNQKQKDIFLNSSNLFSGYIHQKSGQWANYFQLDQENEQLRRENAILLENLINTTIPNSQSQDSIENLYVVTPSTVCSKTVNLRNNYITLCNGKDRGFKKGMGVVNKNGLVGIIQQVSSHYSKVLCVLHSESRISVALKGKDHHGNMIWDTYDNRYATIYNIRKHAKVAIGDTVVTSGFSMVFPPDLIVGVVKSYDLNPGGDGYSIQVELNNSYDQIKNVFVINHLLKEEYDALEVPENE